MSRAYAMSVVVENVKDEQKSCIDDVFEMTCGVDCGYMFNKKYQIDFDINLCGGETEDEFAKRISVEIWKALKEYHPITVTETYMEVLPFEEYSMSATDFNELMNTDEFGEAED